MKVHEIEHVAALFDIINGCVAHTGKFASIQTEAFNALQEFNDECRKRQMARKAEKEKPPVTAPATEEVAPSAALQPEPEPSEASDDEVEEAADENTEEPAEDDESQTKVDPMRRM